MKVLFLKECQPHQKILEAQRDIMQKIVDLAKAYFDRDRQIVSTIDVYNYVGLEYTAW